MTAHLASISAIAAQLGNPGFQPADPSLIGQRGEPAWMRLDRLVVDSRYQREVNKAGVRNIYRIVRAFDWAKFNPIIVAPAQGGTGQYAILDGQHRAIAAHLLRLEHVPCMVHQLELQRQAQVFRDVNELVTKPSKLALHHAAVTAGSADAIAVHTVCRSAGVRMLHSNKALNLMKANETVAVQMVYTALRRHGFEVTRKVLQTLVKAGQDSGIDASLLSAWNISIVSAAMAKVPAVDERTAADVLIEHDLETRLEQTRAIAPPGKGPDMVSDWLAGLFASAAREAA